MSVTLTVQPSSGDPFEVTIDLSSTVLQLKKAIEAGWHVPAEQQRLIYKGQVLADARALDHYGVGAGHTIHLVRGHTPDPPAAPVPAPAFTPLPPLPPLPTAALAALPAGGRPAFNPAGLFQLPGVSSMLSNPDVLRELMLANPATRQIMERNPEVAHALQDPRTLRQAMDMMRNPALMQEMTRNTDRALSNLDTMPGGMDALARLYHEVQRPLEEAPGLHDFLGGVGPLERGTSGSTGERSTSSHRPTGPLDPQPLPNPWQRQGSFGLRGLGRGASGGGLGLDSGLGGMADLYSNPLLQQMTQQAMGNPGAMQLALQGLGTHPRPPSAAPEGPGFPPPPPLAAANPFMSGLMPPALPPADLYRTQLVQLREMGFEDEAAMLAALQATDGNLALALERLLGTRL